MFSKTCFRTLDRPLTVMGLEPGELVLVVLASLVTFLLIGQITGVVLGLALGLGLRQLKAGRPPGFLYYLAYRYGLLRLAPASFRVRHLVAPPWPWQSSVIHMSALEGEVDHERSEVHFYRGRRQFPA